VPVLERGLAVERSAGASVLFPFVAAPLGAAYALAGQIDAGLALLEAVIERATAARLVAGHALRLVWQGEAYLGARQSEHAAPLAARALQIAQKHKEQGSQAYALRLLGDVAVSQDPCTPERAASTYRTALGLADGLGMRPLSARCHLALGQLAFRAGDRIQARNDLNAARSMLREMDMRRWLEQAERVRLD
jgi:tetratricopeptide (TPR) repeat protein